MNKKILLSLSMIGLVMTAVTLFVNKSETISQNMTENQVARANRAAATLKTPGVTKALMIPGVAVPNLPNVFSLGTAVDASTGKKVEGYAIIDYKNEARNSGTVKKGSTACYGFLGSGAKWKSVEPWMMNPTNTSSLDGNLLFAIQTESIAKLEDSLDGTLGNSISKNILGDGTLTSDTLVASTTAPNDKNDIYFADIAEPGVIGVTIVWGIFGGPVINRELVEWDQVYDDKDFSWSLSGEAGKMDFGNISIHELGHTAGLNDQYSSSCTEVTMYGYSALGETKKQSLELPDITGLKALYK